MSGLRAEVDASGVSYAKAQEFLESYTKDGLVEVTTATTGLKNLLSSGLGLEDSITLMKDSRLQYRLRRSWYFSPDLF